MDDMANRFFIVPLVDYEELIEIRTKYSIMADHIENVLRRKGKDNYADYSDGLFKAVIGFKEGEEE